MDDDIRRKLQDALEDYLPLDVAGGYVDLLMAMLDAARQQLMIRRVVVNGGIVEAEPMEPEARQLLLRLRSENRAERNRR